MRLNTIRTNEKLCTGIQLEARFSQKSRRESAADDTAEPSSKSQMAAEDPLAQFYPVSLHPPASLHSAASCVTSPATLDHPRLQSHPFCTGNAPTLAETLPLPQGGKEVGAKTAVPL